MIACRKARNVTLANAKDISRNIVKMRSNKLAELKTMLCQNRQATLRSPTVLHNNQTTAHRVQVTRKK